MTNSDLPVHDVMCQLTGVSLHPGMQILYNFAESTLADLFQTTSYVTLLEQLMNIDGATCVYN